MKHTAKCLSESEEQKIITAWAKLNEGRIPCLRLLNASLMGVKVGLKQMMKAKFMGCKSGYPDLSLPVARGKYHGLYIELKKVKGGRLSDNQKWWLSELEEQGYKAVECKGSAVAIAVIKEYLES